MGPSAATSCNSILVVDDDHDIRVSLRNALEEEGYFVFSAANGISALELLKRIKRPGLILLDLMMPLMNGQDFLKAKNSDPELAQIPVVVMTAFSDPMRPFAVDAIVKKPVEIRQLLSIAARYCQADPQIKAKSQYLVR